MPGQNSKQQSFILFSGIFIVILFLCPLASETRAQDVADNAPPPLRVVSKEELSQLNAASDDKKRIKLSLDMMNVRLQQAETLQSQERYDDMYKSLGAFHGLLDNALAFLEKAGRAGKKTFDNLKRFEIGLRGFRPRLEMVRREIPYRYERYVQNLIKYLRDARSKAVEPLFGDTVLRET